MNLITKHIHIWRLALPWYKCGDLIVWRAHCKVSFTLFGHAIRIY